MTSPAKDIADMLSGAAIGVLATDLYVGLMPEDPPFLISCFDTGGFDANPRYLRDEPTVQIMVRSSEYDYSVAFAKAQEIKNFLLGKSVTVINSNTYTHFWQIGDIIPMGMDENKRHMISSNWHLVVERPSAGNRIPL